MCAKRGSIFDANCAAKWANFGCKSTEWRLFVNLKDKDPINGEYYLDIGPDLVLREIILGARCTAPVGSFRKLVGKVDQSVTIIKARAAFESFSMVRQKNIKPIVVNPTAKKAK